ncbi:hypothetical protein A6A19_00965 [Actinobacillus delphinicola]|uniref:phage terminase small subunit n=1 Tax=Actinobacillus delphinicola TaxID=51161 RepID=UPI002440EDF7|nr:phage terminase small subunit [Actinobacillus delphinicola]MDG6896600.1 hypothetical protein [Actinobacillus delphinicola]
MAGAFAQHFQSSQAKNLRANENHSEYEKMLLLLSRVKKDLKGVHSLRKKNKIKKSYLKDFKSWLDGAIQGNGVQDEILTQWFVWLLDIEEFQLVESIATYCIKYELALPLEFNRTLPTFYIDTLAEIAKVKRLLGKPLPLKILKTAAKLTVKSDIPEMALAKLWREIGLRQAKRGSACAIQSLRKALELNINCGAKTTYNQLLKKQQNPQPKRGKTGQGKA